MSEDNIKVVEVDSSKNTEFVIYTKQINLSKIKEKLYTPDHIKDDLKDYKNFSPDTWAELDGEYFVNIIKCFNNDEVYVALNDFHNDDPSFISYSKSGYVFASSELPVVDLPDEMFYAGDENMEVGKREPFETTNSWLYNGVQEVKSVEQLSLKGQTLKYLLEE